MTPALRKYHRVVWFALALILPVCFVATIMVIPKTQMDPGFRSFQPAALTQILVSAHSDQFAVRLRTDNESVAKQAEIMIKKTLIVPETLVYLSCGQSEKVLLGKLSSMGTYRFPLANVTEFAGCEIEFFNPFNNIVFDKLSL